MNALSTYGKEGELGTLVLEDQLLLMDSTLMSFMTIKRFVEYVLSTICIIYNLILLVFLIKTQEFRKWMFFPMMLQALVDIIGPGVANLIFEWRLESNILEYKRIHDSVYSQYSSFLLPRNFFLFNSLTGIPQCVLVYLRVLLNQYSTGLCMLATAIFRHLAVYHPMYNANEKIGFKIGLGIVLTMFLSVSVGILHLVFAKSRISLLV